jgi:hypothetical protein
MEYLISRHGIRVKNGSGYSGKIFSRSLLKRLEKAQKETAKGTPSGNGKSMMNKDI